MSWDHLPRGVEALFVGYVMITLGLVIQTRRLAARAHPDDRNPHWLRDVGPALWPIFAALAIARVVRNEITLKSAALDRYVENEEDDPDDPEA